MTNEPGVYQRAKPQYLTAEAFSEHFQISRMTTYRLIQDGEVAANRIGRSLRIHVSEVKRYADATRITPAATEESA